MVFKSSLVALCMSVAAMTMVSAEENSTKTRDSGLRGLGVGVIASTQPYSIIDDDYLVNAIPSLSYDKGRVWIQGKQLGVILTDPEGEGPWEVSALLDYRFQGFDGDDVDPDAGFREFEDRNGTLEAGTVITYAMGDARLLGQFRHDVLDEHGGFDLSLQAEYNWQPFKYTFVRPYIGIKFQSEDLADYYFGVREEEQPEIACIALAGVICPEPEAELVGETVNPYVGVFVRQALSKHLVLGGFVTHDFFADEIKESSIIDEEGQTTIGITLSKPFLGKGR